MRLSLRSVSRDYSLRGPCNLIASIYLSVLITLCIGLTQPQFSVSFTTFGVGLSTLGIVSSLYVSGNTTILTYLWGIGSVLVGMSLGTYIDFGLFDMNVLYEICGQSNMLSIAPFSFIGMVLGCNHAMVMSAHSKLTMVNLGYCNAGMLFGMLIFNIGGINTMLTSESLNITIHAFLMIFFGHVFYTFSESIRCKSIYFKLTDYLKAS